MQWLILWVHLTAPWVPRLGYFPGVSGGHCFGMRLMFESVDSVKWITPSPVSDIIQPTAGLNITKGGERRVYPCFPVSCLNWNISSHRILSSEWDANYELLGSQASTDHVHKWPGKQFTSKGLKVPPQKRVRPKASTTHLQVLTRKEADDVLILSGEKSLSNRMVLKTVIQF